MLLDKLLIALILLHYYEERECEKEVTNNIDCKSKCCSIED